jgi:hypothetical protein
MTDQSRHYLVSSVLAIVSLLLFVLAALLLRQGYHAANLHEYGVDRLPIAAAISVIRYQAPLGSVYSGIEHAFLDFSVPIAASFDRAIQGDIPLGDLHPAHFGGIGTGFPLITLVGMYLFGLHLDSIILVFATLIGISTLFFLLRFPGERAFFVALAFATLTLMLLTPLATDAFTAGQAPIAGYRYFSILGIIPGMHLFFELIDDRPLVQGRDNRVYLLTFLQAGILSIATFINIAAIYLLGVLLLGAAARFTGLIGYRATRKQIISIIALIGITYFITHALCNVFASNHFKTATSDMIWHRVFVSLGANPAWPFGDLKAVYADCERYVPGGLVPGLRDQNAYCAWNSYAIAKNLSLGENSAALYGPIYEGALRAAFFSIATKFPYDVAVTFLYYKPLLVVATLKGLLWFDWQKSLTIAAISGLQSCIMFASFYIALRRQWRHYRTVIAGIGLSMVCCGGLYLVAWSLPWTSAELLFWAMALFEVTLMIALVKAVHLLFPRTAIDKAEA